MSITEKIYAYYQTHGSIPPLELLKDDVDQSHEESTPIEALLAIYGIMIVENIHKPEHQQWTRAEQARSTAAYIHNFLVKMATPY